MRKIIVTFLLLSGSFLAYTQSITGISHSNYAGIHGVIANPSYLADARHRVFVNFGSSTGYIFANYFNNSFGKGAYLPIIFPFNENLLSTTFLRQNNNGITGNINLQADIRGPSALFKFNDQIGLALTTRLRGFVLGNHIPTSIAKAFATSFKETELETPASNNADFSVHQSVFSEIGISYAQKLFSVGPHFLKSGITTKYIHGIRTSFVGLEKFSSTPDSEKQLRINSGAYQYGYSNPDEINFNIGNLFFSPDNFGKGWGVDLGFTYEYRPALEDYEYIIDGKKLLNHEQNKYLIRAGIVVLDLGFIYYNNPSARIYNAQIPNAVIKSQTIMAIYNSPLAALNNLLSIQDPQHSTPFQTRLPTIVNFNFDYRYNQSIYLNLNSIIGFKAKSPNNLYQHSAITLTPRYENQHYEFLIPVSLIHDYRYITLGAALRGGPAFIGIDNLGGLLNFSKVKGSYVYAGIGFYLGDKKIKDSDHDGVSDKADVCPDIPGLWAFKGCPDSDGDGIEDQLDDCPMDPGFVELNGCPDSDSDGLIDKADACPKAAGKLENQGCPMPDSSIILKPLTANARHSVNQAEKLLSFDSIGTTSLAAQTALDSVTALLNEYPESKLAIIEVTEKPNTAEQNKVDYNVTAVEQYFVSKGIAPERLLKDQLLKSNLSQRFTYNQKSKIILRIVE